MTTRNEKFVRLQELEKIQDAEYPTDFPHEDAGYEVRLRNTLQYLHDQVKQEEEYLQEVRVHRIQFDMGRLLTDNPAQATAEILRLVTLSTL